MAAKKSRPVGGEFKLLYDRQNRHGLPEAMKAFAARFRSSTRFFVTAVLTQRETAATWEVLDNLASVIRDRFKVKRQIRVLTAPGESPGGCWRRCRRPGRAMMMTTPQHLRLLINDPLGVQMIVGAILLQIIGTLIIRKLVNIPY
jgi:tight adherence protein B